MYLPLCFIMDLKISWSVALSWDSWKILFEPGVVDMGDLSPTVCMCDMNVP